MFCPNLSHISGIFLFRSATASLSHQYTSLTPPQFLSRISLDQLYNNQFLSRKELQSCSTPQPGPPDETSSLATSHHLCMLEVRLSTLSALAQIRSLSDLCTYLQGEQRPRHTRATNVFLEVLLLKYVHSERLGA